MNTRILLDTHVLLRLLNDPRRLDRETKALIDRADVYVSVASIWEISIKAALGKLSLKPAEVLQAVEPSGFSLLSIQGEHAARVYELGRHHQDPFDRLLIAQAQLESMTLLTHDETLAAYGDTVRVL
ncbi:MAG: type II toxin-antitoxin system VapC family toxin [Pseudomonadota bacterium]